MTIGLIFFDDLVAGLLALTLPALYALGIWAYSRLFPVRPLFKPRIVAVMGEGSEE